MQVTLIDRGKNAYAFEVSRMKPESLWETLNVPVELERINFEYNLPEHLLAYITYRLKEVNGGHPVYVEIIRNFEIVKRKNDCFYQVAQYQNINNEGG
jgi:hypothetical protein